MFFKRVNGKSLLGLFLIALFVLGIFVGVCGSLHGLIGTQAMSGRESVFELLLVFGIYHVLAWGLGGLITAMATAGFVGVTTERRWLVASVLPGYVGGWLIAALIFGIYQAFFFRIHHILLWGLCGLLAATKTAGFVGATTGRRRLVVSVLSGFVGGGAIVALIFAALMRTGVRWNIYHAIILEILVPPAIGAAMLVRALHITRTLDNSNASYSTQESAD